MKTLENKKFTKEGFKFEVKENRIHWTSENRGLGSFPNSEHSLNKFLRTEKAVKEEKELQAIINEMSIPEFLKSSHYAYYKVRSCGVTFYKHSSLSPTGVSSAKGCETSELKSYLN